MSVIFTEGFDKYGPAASYNLYPATPGLVLGNEWTSSTASANSMNVVTGLSETGQAISIGSLELRRTLAASYSRVIGGVRFMLDPQGSLGSWGGVGFRDALNADLCSITTTGAGLFAVRTGGSSSSSIIGISTVSVAAATTHYLEWDITIGTSGSFAVWLDGVPIVSGVGNTQNGSAYSSLSSFVLYGSSNSGTIFDDVYLFSPSGSFNNQVLLTNPRIETKFPSSDYSIMFVNQGNIVGQGQGRSILSEVASADTMYLQPISPLVSCTANTINFYPIATNVTAQVRPVLYSSVSGAPSILLSAGATVTGCTSSVMQTMALTTSVALSPSTQYWVGFMTNASLQVTRYDGVSKTADQLSAAYTSGAPGSIVASSLTTGQVSLLLYAGCTGSAVNYISVDDQPALGDQSSVLSSNPGDEDLFNFPAPSTDINKVYAVGLKVNCKLSTTGTRTVSFDAVSGSTVSSGTLGTIQPSTGYNWYGTYYDTDPNTGTTWTSLGLTNAKFGYKVES